MAKLEQSKAQRQKPSEPVRTLESAKLIPVSILDPNPHQRG